MLVADSRSPDRWYFLHIPAAAFLRGAQHARAPRGERCGRWDNSSDRRIVERWGSAGLWWQMLSTLGAIELSARGWVSVRTSAIP